MLVPMRERAAQFEQDPELLNRILREGAERARVTARETLHDVRQAMGLIGSWAQ
jgi:tryptophanyl-tRNA synthetase